MQIGVVIVNILMFAYTGYCSAHDGELFHKIPIPFLYRCLFQTCHQYDSTFNVYIRNIILLIVKIIQIATIDS